LLQQGQNFGQIDVQMGGFLQHRSAVIHDANGIDQVFGIQQLPAILALIPPGVIVMAMGTLALDVAVSQEHLAFFGIQLLDAALGDIAGFIHRLENTLDNFGLVCC
jgi:hypothetical protein